MNWFILIPLIVGLICALFGYLLGRQSSKVDDNTEYVELLKIKNEELEDSVADCKSKLIAALSSHESGESTADTIVSEDGAVADAVPFDANEAKASFGKIIKQDDLTVVSGIGPKIQELFQDSGITTWHGLSETSVQRCQEILNTGGERYRVHDPGTWPRQAGMASEGKWQELRTWQDNLDHGKEK